MDPTMTIKYPKDFFGHPQANTLSDINITREDIKDAIKIISQIFWRPWWISSNTSQTMPQEPSPPSPTAVWASLKTCEMPLDLKGAIIKPIYKGGSRNLHKNYCPVALTSNLIKILEKILTKNILQFLKTHQKMNPKQHGFCSGRSCLSQLLEHHNKKLEELESQTMLMWST